MITATGSGYTLTVNAAGSTLARSKGEHPVHPMMDGAVPGELRRDGDEIKVEEIVHLEVGARAEFLLDLRQDGIITQRTTSPVISLEQIPEPKSAPQ